jgi:hypothetical protein
VVTDQKVKNPRRGSDRLVKDNPATLWSKTLEWVRVQSFGFVPANHMRGAVVKATASKAW